MPTASGPEATLPAVLPVENLGAAAVAAVKPAASAAAVSTDVQPPVNHANNLPKKRAGGKKTV